MKMVEAATRSRAVAKEHEARSRKILIVSRDASIAVIAAIITLALLEIGLRAAGVKYSGSFYTRDAERGYALRPYAEGWWINENPQYAKLNRLGYHDREHSIAKPPGVVRIAVVGSSYVSAPDVPVNRNFVSVLERLLNRHSEQKYTAEVFNFGVNAYCPVQSYYTLNKSVWRYSPDIILFVVSNIDILETCRDVAFRRQFNHRPFFELDSTGKIVPDRTSRSTPMPSRDQVEAEDRRNQFMNQYRLTTACNEALYKVSSRLEEEPPERKTAYASIFYYPHALTFLPPPRNGPMEQAWRVFEALVPELKLDSQKHDAELWLLSQGMPEQENPNPTIGEEFKRKVGADDLYYWDKRVDAIAQENGIHSLRLPPLMATYAAQHHVYLHGFFFTPPGQGHWNDKGNEVAGQLIAANLLESSKFFRSIQ